MENKFDKAIEEAMLEEGKFKSLAAATMMGLGAMQGGNAEASPRPPIEQSHISDSEMISRTLPITEWAEDFKPNVYLDSKKKQTIGYGFNLEEPYVQRVLRNHGHNYQDFINGKAITEEESRPILMELMEPAVSDAKQFAPNWDQIDPLARTVLVDMAYNLGLTRLSGFKNLRDAISKLDYERAKKEMIDSAWFKQVGRRSKRLSNVMDTVISRYQ